MTDQEISLETYRSMISHGAAAVKAAMLVNGGAAVALLAFMGNVWKPGSPGQVPDMIWPMALFNVGLGLGALATATAYLTQLFFYMEGQGTAERKKHGAWLSGSIILVILSLTCFVCGSMRATWEFSTVMSIASEVDQNDGGAKSKVRPAP